MSKDPSFVKHYFNEINIRPQKIVNNENSNFFSVTYHYFHFVSAMNCLMSFFAGGGGGFGGSVFGNQSPIPKTKPLSCWVKDNFR